jgi:hypothetical protein
MKKDAKCGICGTKQGYGEQRIFPIVNVGSGKTIWRCGEHLNVSPKEGEAEPYKER